MPNENDRARDAGWIKPRPAAPRDLYAGPNGLEAKAMPRFDQHGAPVPQRGPGPDMSRGLDHVWDEMQRGLVGMVLDQLPKALRDEILDAAYRAVASAYNAAAGAATNYGAPNAAAWMVEQRIANEQAAPRRAGEQRTHRDRVFDAFEALRASGWYVSLVETLPRRSGDEWPPHLFDQRSRQMLVYVKPQDLRQAFDQTTGRFAAWGLTVTVYGDVSEVASYFEREGLIAVNFDREGFTVNSVD